MNKLSKDRNTYDKKVVNRLLRWMHSKGIEMYYGCDEETGYGPNMDLSQQELRKWYFKDKLPKGRIQ